MHIIAVEGLRQQICAMLWDRKSMEHTEMVDDLIWNEHNRKFETRCNDKAAS